MIDDQYINQSLLHKLAAGDINAFNQLFKVLWDKVYSAALVLTKSSELAEDISQEVFLRLWQNRSNATSIENLEAFLFITARNLIYTRLSRIKLEAAYSTYLRHQVVKPESDTEMKTDLLQLRTIIDTGIRQLPPQQQKAFRLSREKGLSHEEISQQMGVSRATVKDYIVKAIAFLRKYLQEHAPLFIWCCLHLF